jgi:putative PIN family toxin of toxin-antitoxin system
MRVIIDTNVLISGIFFGGPPAKILEAWHGGELKLVVSPEILEEYFEVCERISVRYPDIDIAPILVLVARNSQVVESPPLAEQISRDLDDDKFIACAIASDTRTIISGDNDLLTVSGYERVQVMTPRDFVDKHIL